MQYAIRIVKAALAGILLYSGLQHAANPYLFASAMAGYEILPKPLLAIVPFVLPHVMIVVAVCLLLDRFSNIAVRVALLLFMSFTIAQVWALVSGRSISCGCFGFSREAISWKSASIPFFSFLANMLIIRKQTSTNFAVGESRETQGIDDATLCSAPETPRCKSIA